MQKKSIVAGVVALALGLGVGTSSVQADSDDMWDMMNPAWWMGLDDDDDDDWKYWVYGPGRYRHGGGPWGGYGYPGYGQGYGYRGYPGATNQKKAAPAPLPVPE